nr:protein CLT2, chloroplastic [Ipomoea batatas]
MPPSSSNRRHNLSLPPSFPINLLGQRFEIRRRKTVHTEHSPSTSSRFAIRASSESTDAPPTSNTKAVILNSSVTVILGIANRVLYKLALVPMKEYPFFLAQVTTFGYLGIYFCMLYLRYRAGIVTKDMLTLPKSSFWLIGFLEALGVVSGMYAGAMLPGPSIPILSQTFLVWQLALSFLLLGRTYSPNQIFGCLLVAAGVVLAVTRS